MQPTLGGSLDAAQAEPCDCLSGVLADARSAWGGPQDAVDLPALQHRPRWRTGERGTDARRYRRRGHPGDSLTCALPQRPLHLTTWPMLLDRRVCRRTALRAKARSSNACQTRLPERSSGSTAPSASTRGKFASRTPIMGIPHLSANRSANHPGRTRAHRGGSGRLNYLGNLQIAARIGP